jgi:hypothetical protein
VLRLIILNSSFTLRASMTISLSQTLERRSLRHSNMFTIKKTN